MSSSKSSVGSYGRIFIPSEKRVRANLRSIYYDIVDEETRENILLPNPNLNYASQNLGRLLNTGIFRYFNYSYIQINSRN